MAVLEYEKNDHIALITLNRPEKMNALNSELLDMLQEAWYEFQEDQDTWVAILTGAGKAFCVGADMESIGEPGIEIGFNVLREDPTTHGVTKPIIGAVNGHVIGRGIALFLACDIRIVCNQVKISIPEAKFGVIPGDTNILENNIPAAIAKEMFFTGDSIGAQRAYEIGLVNKVVPQEDLLNEAKSLAKRLTKNSPLALQGIKEMFNRRRDMDYRSTVCLYEKVNRRIIKSSDHKEGMKSIKERREPNWKGA